MNNGSPLPPGIKISHEFAQRLIHLEPGRTVRAIVVLNTGVTGHRSRRRTTAGRSAAVRAVRKAAGSAMPDIDNILREHGGQRLAPGPDALGSIPVEATAGGITALAGSPRVKAVLEDQSLSLLS